MLLRIAPRIARRAALRIAGPVVPRIIIWASAAAMLSAAATSTRTPPAASLPTLEQQDGSAILRCPVQQLEAIVTSAGLRVRSTSETEGAGELVVRAAALGRPEELRAVGPGRLRIDRRAMLAAVRRPELTEEYSVSAEGVRQDFILAERPAGVGPLQLALTISGATLADTDDGVRLTMAGGRELRLAKLYVEDATGRRVAARLTSGDGRVLVEVDDADAAYPLRIDPTISDAQWHSLGGVAGTTATIYAAAASASGQVYVGGSFIGAGEVVTNNVAMWTGSAWTPLGVGTGPGFVNALALDGSGGLYAAGTFLSAGGVGVNRLARWSGSTWSDVGAGVAGVVYALAVDSSGSLYVGGTFTTAGGTAANRVAKWNGSAWSALGSGVSGTVRALAVDGAGNVYVGGDFTTAGGAPANRIARWNGSAWSALGNGMDAPVRALAVDSSGTVYAGGSFGTAGSAPASYVAAWKSGSWSAVGSGVSDTVYALAVDGSSNLYAGGSFLNAGGAPANRMAMWNGSAWSALGTGVSSTVNAVAAAGTGVVAAGAFTTAGGTAAAYVAQWQGGAWSRLGSGMGDAVRALASTGGAGVHAGGDFTTAADAVASRVATWNSSAWSALGAGVSGRVSALALAGADLYVGGDFATAGGATASRIAVWDGSAWSPVGSGMDNAVAALAVDLSGDLYAGGSFTTAGGGAANGIARWDGALWSTLGGVSGGFVRALAVGGAGDVVVAGDFTLAGTVPANRIAAFDGSAWSALGAGVGGAVRGLAVADTGLVYAGGEFTSAGGAAANYVARWNGSTWAALGTGTSGYVNALAVDSAGSLFVGGAFSTAGGVTANYVALWDGSTWSALGSGLNGPVFALLMADDGNLYVGGAFTTAGGKVSGYAALLDLPPTVVLATAAAEPTAMSPIVVTATFSEGVSGLGVDDFSVSNGAATNVMSVTDRLWQADITPAAPGVVTVSLQADRVQALSDGNGNYASQPLSRTYVDTTPPSVTAIARADATPTNADTAAFTVAFSEPVEGGDSASFTLVTSGTVAASQGSVLGSGSSRTVSVTGITGDGTLALALVASPGIADVAGNALVGPYPSSEIYSIDNTPPAAPSILAIATDTGIAADDGITSDDTLVVTGTAEADNLVELFGAGGVSLGTTSADSLGAWSLDLTGTPLASGTHALTATATDAAGNESVASATFTAVVDTTRPAVASTVRSDSSPTRATSVAFAVTLTEAVSALDGGDFVLTVTDTANGDIGSIVVNSASSYTVTIDNVSGDGTLRLDLVGSPSAYDDAGNALSGPYAAGQAYVVDNTAPYVVSLSADGSSPTNAESLTFTLVANEELTGLDTADFALTTTGSATGTVAGVTASGASYTITVNAVSGVGTIGLDLVAAPATSDLAGTPLDGPYASDDVYTVDRVAPEVTSIIVLGTPSASATSVAFTVTTSESVSGLTIADFVLTTDGTADGDIAAITGAGTTYTVTVVGVTGEGSLRLDIVTSPAATDTVGNLLVGPFTAGATFAAAPTGPTVSSIARADASPTAASSVGFVVIFSELVHGVDAADFALTLGGSATGSVTSVHGSGASYVVTVGDVGGVGSLRLDVIASPTINNAASQRLHGPYTAGATYVIDAVAPTLSAIVRSEPSPTRSERVTFGVTIDKPVNGLDPSDFILVTTGTASGALVGVSGRGTTYTALVDHVTGNGTLRLDVVARPIAYDGAGNLLRGPYTAGESYEVDTLAPAAPSGLFVVADTGTPGDGLTANAALAVCGTAEALAIVSVSIDAAYVGDTTADEAGLWCRDPAGEPLADGSHTVTASARDGIGNEGRPSAPLIVTVDTVAPRVLAIRRLGPTPTSADAVELEVTVSEAVTGVDIADFVLDVTGTVSGGISAVRGSGSIYIVSITDLNGDGRVRLDLAAATDVVDAAGLLLAGPYAGGQAYDVDHTPPDAPAVTSAAADTTSTTPMWTWASGANGGDGTFRYQLDALEESGWQETRGVSFTPPAALGLGTHTLYVLERDAAGNWSAPGSFAIAIVAELALDGDARGACGCASGGGATTPPPISLSLVLAGLAVAAARRRPSPRCARSGRTDR